MKANQLRKGSVIVYQNAPYRVMEFQNITPGKGNSVTQTKMRNLITGNQTEVRFATTEEVIEADVYSFSGTYLYNDAEGYHFMNSTNYDEVVLSKELVGDGVYYLQDQMQVSITLYNDSPIGIELPSTVVLTVIETEPEMKGATASNSPKPAKTDTGLTLNVPPFIKVGEKIIVNTEEGKYLGRG